MSLLRTSFLALCWLVSCSCDALAQLRSRYASENGVFLTREEKEIRRQSGLYAVSSPIVQYNYCISETEIRGLGFLSAKISFEHEFVKSMHKSICLKDAALSQLEGDEIFMGGWEQYVFFLSPQERGCLFLLKDAPSPIEGSDVRPLFIDTSLLGFRRVLKGLLCIHPDKKADL
jgi:hypothetical protein